MIKHTGIYVSDLEKMEMFYVNVFDMHFICRNQPFSHPLMQELLEENIPVRISKLVTEYGKNTGIGDMIELIEAPKETMVQTGAPKIWKSPHIAFGVGDVIEAVEKIVKYGGKQKTAIHDMGNGNLCCFCTDPENNWIELIGKVS